MAISPLLSMAGTALVPLARDLVEQISDGLSFQQMLGSRGAGDAAPGVAASGHAPAIFPASPEAARLEAIRRQPHRELAALVDRLRERLSAAGIELSAPVPLKIGVGGDIQVDGDHPQRAAIEDLLNADAQLTSTFRQVAGVLAGRHNATTGDLNSTELRLTIGASDFKLAFE